MKKLYENSSDGWSEAIQTAVQDACDDISQLQYEINSCVRGSFTNCDSAEELADYIRSLANNLLSAADDVEGCPTSDDDDDDLFESRKAKKAKMKESESTGKHVTFDFTGAPGYMGDGIVTVEQDSNVMVTWPNGYQQKLIVELDHPYLGTEVQSKRAKPSHFYEDEDYEDEDYDDYAAAEDANEVLCEIIDRLSDIDVEPDMVVSKDEFESAVKIAQNTLAEYGQDPNYGSELLTTELNIEIEDEDDEFYESAKTNHSIKECRKPASRKQFAAAYGKKLHESKAKPKARKPYKMREAENPYEWDVKTEKKALRKQFPAMSDNEMTIKAAAKIAKKNNVTRKTVLATLKPANNIKGEKTWDKEGNVFTK